MIVHPAPAYSLFKYVYLGPHIDDDNLFDRRVWFYLPLAVDEENNTATYLRFPHMKNEEIEEITINMSTLF